MTSARLNLGILGSDPRIAAVAVAAMARGDRVALAADVPAGLYPGAELVAADALLDPVGCDWVLAGADGWSDQRREVVRLLPLLIRPHLAAEGDS